MNALITVSIRRTYLLGVVFLALPLLIWCFGWLSLPYALLAAASLVFCIWMIWKKTEGCSYRFSDVKVSIPIVLAILLVVLVWCILGGHGGFLYQSSDWNARNAVFRDLIMYEWPVVYENGNALCYYFGFWLPPALVGKAFLALGLGADLVWGIANVALLLWTALGVFLAILLLLQSLKRVDLKAICLVVVLFVFFSGMDVVGLLLAGDQTAIIQRFTQKVHIEWWAEVYQFSSFTTQLFWVFNQAVPAWIATLLILSTSRVNNDLFVGVLSAFLCPLPTMGLLFIGLAKLIGEIRDSGIRAALKAFCSPQNLVVLIPLVFVAMFLMLSQRASLGSVSSGDSAGLFHTYIGGFTQPHILRLLLFFFLECGLLFLLLLPSERKNPYWWGALILLMVANVVRLGPSPDFSMRASIPGLMVLLVMVLRHLAEWDFQTYYQWIHERRKKPVDVAIVRVHQKAIGIALVICLIIGSVTPLVEIARGPVKMAEAQTVPMPYDRLKTLSGGPYANFVTLDYEDSVFARTFGK